MAAMTARLDVVKMLLDRGADPKKADIDRGETPLHGAVRTHSMTVLRLLLKAGADPNKGDKDKVIPLLGWRIGNFDLTNDLTSQLMELNG